MAVAIAEGCELGGSQGECEHALAISDRFRQQQRLQAAATAEPKAKRPQGFRQASDLLIAAARIQDTVSTTNTEQLKTGSNRIDHQGQLSELRAVANRINALCQEQGAGCIGRDLGRREAKSPGTIGCGDHRAPEGAPGELHGASRFGRAFQVEAIAAISR